ncbi:MAG TPA: F0F1 ATP synthase subunit epsilon [Bacteroidota bacterium]|nr:F0F1 ATP synthase subunit epsilon [Bacteroidota bacterium]
MAEKTFHLEIVTPKKVVYKALVESFSAPGVVGGFQVLRSHAPLLSAIGVGEVKIIDAQGNEFRYATSGGFVEVHENKVVMLAETAERADEIDVKRAEAARDRAQKRIAEKRIETDIERARAALHRALNRLKVARRVAQMETH